MHEAYHLTNEGCVRMSMSFGGDNRQLFLQPMTTGMRCVAPWLPDLGWNLALTRAEDVHVYDLSVADFVSRGLDLLDQHPDLVNEVGDSFIIEFRLPDFQSTTVPIGAYEIDDWHEEFMAFLFIDRVFHETMSAMLGDPDAAWTVVEELAELERQQAFHG